jgi:hypothetical protein
MLIRKPSLTNLAGELFVDVVLDVVEEPFGAGQFGSLANTVNI